MLLRLYRGKMTKRTDSNWIQTYTGKQFWPLNARHEDVCIEDIAHALSLKCRFSGHTNRFYSVAQHSVMVSFLCEFPEHSLLGLLHDAAEAYLPDISSPIKPFIEGFIDTEDRLLNVIFEVFNIRSPLPDVAKEDVRQSDLVALATEKRDLLRHTSYKWGIVDNINPSILIIVPQSPEQAERSFLYRFYELCS